MDSEEKAERIRENLADAKHPDDYEDDEYTWGAYMAYAARLLWRAGQDHESVAETLAAFQSQDGAVEQTRDSGAVSDAVADAAPETADELDSLALSGAAFIRACRYADAALHGVDSDEE